MRGSNYCIHIHTYKYVACMSELLNSSVDHHIKTMTSAILQQMMRLKIMRCKQA